MSVNEEEYDLKLSKDKLGTLIPILTDANGNIIDGFHRQKIDPNWFKIKIEHITDPVQLSMARLASNVCRRNVPAEEKTKLLANIAELTGWDAKEIAEALGMSYTWVMKYLPEGYKREYPKSTQRVDIQKDVKTPQLEPLPEPIQAKEPARCSECNVITWYPYTFQDKILCKVCFEDHWKKGEVGKQDLELPPSEPFESQSLTPTVPVESIDTGFVFECPTCNRKFHLIHVNPSGKHKFEEDMML